MTKKIEQSRLVREKTGLSIMEMLVTVAVVGASIGFVAATAHSWADYGFVAVEVLLLVGLIRSIVQDLERRLASPGNAAGTTPARQHGSENQ
ncbi:hypothetical protein KTD31_03580 [Burkholderia multivorans]|uniref:hypothetical protein n=1 Tax=Burkholderia multivorans TaxID=87883 RepID=UPI001C24D41D|nr:hypothetical protein [Burkholderia multivorans]MBU9200435.1 hypothetical protein [Burkholderia multivorans]MDN8078440.1 hypothetical protein [Burkholderia multivorans]